MAVSQDEVNYGVRTLTGLVQLYAGQRENNSRYQRRFRQGRPLVPGLGGVSVEWDEIQFHRHLAPVVGRDQAHPIVEDMTTVLRSATPAHVKQSFLLPASKLLQERAPGQPFGTVGGQEHLRQKLADCVQLITNTIEYMAAQSLGGTLTINSTNVPGTTLPFTVTYSPNTGTATTTWATASTDVLADITAAKIDFYQSCLMQPRDVLIGSTIQNHLNNNTGIQALLQTQMGATVARTGSNLFGSVYDGFELGGMRWEVNEAVYTPQGGSATRFHPATDKLIMLPGGSDLMDTLGLCEARGIVPLPGSDVAAAAIGADGMVSVDAGGMFLESAPGWYAWAQRVASDAEGMGVKVNVGWCGLPVVVQPGAVLVHDTVP